MRKKIFHGGKRLIAGVLALSLSLVAPMQMKSAKAAADTADLRLVFTSDIHGQVTTEDYETGKLYTTGGYSRTVSLVKEARAEVNKNNSMLFDLGDSLYDYTTDYIYDYNSSAQQPVYNAMAKMGYDAMVLGNHDFDYTLGYIKNQLAGAKLTGKVVLSNVWDANTKKHIWAENRIITKSLVTEGGKTLKVKVGLIGETVPGLSKKRTSYKGVLETEDIVKNTKTQVAKLKKAGADVIIVLAHSGIGDEKPAELDNNTGYALTKISGVDAVLCGHLHTDFPSKNGTKWDDLPGVNKVTGLVNGKPLVQIENRGASVGVADLELYSSNGKIGIKSGRTSIRKVNSKTEVNQTINNIFGNWSKTFLNDCSLILSEVDTNAQLQNYFGTQEDNDAIQLLNTIKMGFGLNYINNKATAYKNYPVVAASSYIKYGSDGDSDYVDIREEFRKSNMYQLVKYRTGLYLYRMTGAQIKEWLEWSASCYELPGENLIEGTENNKPEETEAPTDAPDSAVSPGPDATPGTDGTAEPSVTPGVTEEPEATPASEASKEPEATPPGEASEEPEATPTAEASKEPEATPTAETSMQPQATPTAEATATPGNGGTGINPPLSEPKLKSLSELLSFDTSKPFQYTLQNDFLDDWSSFYVFDGLEYTINTKEKPRYSDSGKKINNTNRITSLTRNGAAVKGTDVFVVATHRLPNNTLFNSMNPTKIVSTSTETYRKHIQKSIENISMTGTIKSMQDDNWNVTYSDDYHYLLRSGEEAQHYIETKPWITNVVGNEFEPQYYVTDFDKLSKEDTSGPSLTAVSLNESETNKNVPIAIQATDRSGIASIRYVSGKYSAENSIWSTAAKVSGKTLSIANNGTYSICAIDKKGNRSVVHVRVLNINRSILDTPVVSTYSNRKKYIEGKAEAGARIYFKIENGPTYSVVVGKNGKFKYALPPQPAGRRIFVYVIDGKGRTSARTIVTVKRTGPNKPSLNAVKTNTKTIMGTVNDSYAYPVIILNGKKVYVPNKNVKSLYKKSSIYNKKYSVSVGKVKMYSNGRYAMTLPRYWKAKEKIQVKTVDAIARTSLVNTKTVKQTVANPPKINNATVSNTAKAVNLYTDEKIKSAVVKIGKKTYKSGKKSYNKKSKKYRYRVAIPRTDTGTKMKAYFVNVKGKSTAVAFHTYLKAPNKPKVDVAAVKDKTITGKVDLVAKGKKPATVANSKTKVYAYVNGKKHVGKVKNDGTFSVKVPALKAKDKVVVKAKNRLGKSQDRKVPVKKKKPKKKKKEAKKPSDTGKPSASDKPGTTAKPAATAKPGTAKKSSTKKSAKKNTKKSDKKSNTKKK